MTLEKALKVGGCLLNVVIFVTWEFYYQIRMDSGISRGLDLVRD
jgi:hypothetical protein